MTDLEKQEKIKDLFESRKYFREKLDRANMKITRAEQEIDFVCDILQGIGLDLMRLGIDPMQD